MEQLKKNQKIYLKQKIKYYNTLQINKDIIIKHLKNFAHIRKIFNYNIKNKIKFSKNFLYNNEKKKLKGFLNINNWKNKKKPYNFCLVQKKQKDNKLYEIWNLKTSYLKYVYSKINRLHFYKQIYNIARINILNFPYDIIIKPYSILIKNFYTNNFLLVFEWNNKWKKNFIIIKIIKKNLIKQLNNIKLLQLNNNKNLLNLYKINIKTYTNFNKWKSNLLIKQNFKCLYWKMENWIWRFRSNWKFTKLCLNKYTKRYRFFLLKILNIKIKNITYYENLLLDIFNERYINTIKTQTKNNKYFSKLKNNIYKNLFFKIKNYYIKKFSLKNNTLYNNLYKSLFFWILYFFQNIYLNISKSIFNLWIKKFYIIKNILENNKINFIFNLNILYKKLYYQNYNIYNFEYNFYKNIKIYYNYFNCFNMYIFLKKTFDTSFFSYKQKILIKYNILNTANSFFKNIFIIYNNKIHNYYFLKNNNFINSNKNYLLDLNEYNNYVYVSTYNKSFFQTYRSFNYIINKEIQPQKKINFNKLHQGLNIINFQDIYYSNFELNINNDKKLYYI
jgi:hypothetical protein